MRSSFAVLLTATACHPHTPAPCISSDTCGAGRECLANHCAPLGSDPVPVHSERYVLHPAATALVGAAHPQAATGLPVAAVFGSRVEGPVTWYLDFTPTWSPADRVDRAFLVLSPIPDGTPAGDDIDVDVWRVAQPWRSDALSWLAQPPREPPRARGIARSAPPHVLRLDVTEIVEYWQAHPHDRHGLAIEAGRGRGHGVAFSTGAAAGSGPKLEVYVSEEAG